MDKYTITELEAHANRWVMVYFHSLVHPTITSFLAKFKTFFPPKLPKDETCVEKMCFCVIDSQKTINASFTNVLIWNIRWWVDSLKI
jgi:hypothetical protein